jgi:hypothetical protein
MTHADASAWSVEHGSSPARLPEFKLGMSGGMAPVSAASTLVPEEGASLTEAAPSGLTVEVLA